MASITKETKWGRIGCRLRFYIDNKQKSIWLGEASDAVAATWKANVGHLCTCYSNGSVHAKSVTEWLTHLHDDQYEKLARAGLVEPRQAKAVVQIPKLEQFVTDYVKSCKSAKPATKEKFEQAKANLISFFGRDRPIDQITAVEAIAWREWLMSNGNARESKSGGKTTLSDNTVRRRTGIAKQFFKRAIQAKFITENPFDGLPCSVHANEARQHFVPQRMIVDLIEDFCPNAEWRAVLAFARFAGMRCPSEPMALRWADVDFRKGSLRIYSPKTAHHRGSGIRYCPIFPELRPYLEDLARIAQERDAKPSDYVLQSTRGSEAFYRTGLMKILKRAKLEKWPKLFQNLRASRETELLAEYPIKDVCSWIGNSQAVAMKHYAMTMEASFARATGLGGLIGGLKADASAATAGNPKPSWDSPTSEKTKEKEASESQEASLGIPWLNELMGDTGLEPVTPCL